MSYRLAYDHSETIAAIASVAGAAANSNHPAPPHPVNVLQIHGKAFQTICNFTGDRPAVESAYLLKVSEL